MDLIAHVRRGGHEPETIKRWGVAAGREAKKNKKAKEERELKKKELVEKVQGIAPR